MSIKQIIGLTLIGITLLIFVFGGYTTVPAGHRGVEIRMGAVTGRILDEGFSTKVPLIVSVRDIEVRTQKEQISTEGASKDLQMVKIEAALNYHPVPEKVAELYKTVGEQYMQRIVDPSMQETIKAVVAQYTAEELVTKRELVRVAIGKLLTEKLDPHGIRVEAFNIVDFDFSGAFNAAIEAKVTAEQQALAAKNKLAQVEFEAQQKVAEAKGKAEAMRVESEALAKTPQILELRALEKWDGKLPHVTGGTIPFINVDQKESTEATVARRLAR